MKDYVMIRFYLIILFIFFMSCNHRNKRLQEQSEQWLGKEIIIPQKHLKTKILGRDTVCDDFFQKKYKVMMYVDSTECVDCKLQLYQWSKFIDEHRMYDDKLAILIIVHNQNPKIIDILTSQYEFVYPIFYDKGGLMNSLNHFPYDIEQQTFLLSQENKVLVVGNPVRDIKVKNKIEAIISNDK